MPIQLESSCNACFNIIPSIVKFLEEKKCLTNGPPLAIVDNKITRNTISTLIQLVVSNKVADVYSFLEKFISQPVVDLNDTCCQCMNMLYNSCMNVLHGDCKRALFSPDKTLVEKYNAKLPNPAGDVTITMTTCKRFDLWERTVWSMLHCISDLDQHVKDWIVVDDNCDPALIDKAKATFPFITWICKTPDQSGHPKSMNIIRDTVKTPFWFHVEDDFEFFSNQPYLTKMKNILNADPSYKQCQVNVHYTEDSSTACTIWGGKTKTINNQPYVEHLHYKGLICELESKKLGFANCYYWPHFSFRPALTKTEIHEQLGPYNTTPNVHFEMDYADKYAEKGFKTVFLPGTFCTHIGRRTYERNSGKKNAYDLNNQSQFGEPVKNDAKPASTLNAVKPAEINAEGPVGGTKASTSPNLPPPDDFGKPLSVDCNVINLKRRPERILSFVKRNNKELPPFQVFYGVDGSKIEPNFKVQKCFETGDFNYRKGIVGCALSHIMLWKQLASDWTCDYSIILEDDAILAKNFIPRVMNLITENKGNFDLMFLHYLPWAHAKKEEDYFQAVQSKATFYSRQKSIESSMGGATAYILTRNGARKLLNHVDKHGVYNGIDWVMFKASGETPVDENSPELNVMYSSPFLAFAECVQNDNRVDSDIQRDYNSCGYTEAWSKAEVMKLSKDFGLKITTDDPKMISYLATLGISAEQGLRTSQIICKAKLEASDPHLNMTICIGIKSTNLPTNANYVWYTTDKLVISVPHEMASDTFLKNHTLFNHRLNMNDII